MSAINKIKIALELLKETNNSLENDSLKVVVADNIFRVQLLLNAFDSQVENDFETEKVSFGMLQQITRFCFQMLSKKYEEEKNDENKNEEKLTREQAKQLIKQILTDKQFSDKVNMNVVIKHLGADIDFSQRGKRDDEI